jgi:hypothetical protein
MQAERQTCVVLECEVDCCCWHLQCAPVWPPVLPQAAGACADLSPSFVAAHVLLLGC